MQVPAPTDGETNLNHLASFSNRLHPQKNSAIFRLLPETLAEIFTHGARDYHESHESHTFCIPHWVHVSYVCRHWRNVALNCPTLWTYHFTVSLRWTEELLARSKQALLKIRIYFDYERATPWWSELLRKVLRHTDRIQELRLHVPATVLPLEFSLRAPYLEILDLRAVWSHSSQWTPTINDRNIPPLRILQIADYQLPWQSFNLSRVTSLFLSCLPVPSEQDIMVFLATLSHMQTLTSLHLECSFASSRHFLSNGAFDVLSKIDLPSLSRLCFRESLSTVVALLSCINIPLKTEALLEFQWEDGSSIDDYAQIYPAIARRFSHSRNLISFCPAIQSLAIQFPLSFSIFTLWASEHIDYDHPLSTKYFSRWEYNSLFMITVETGWSMTSSDEDRIINDICSSIPLTDVQDLCIIEPPLSVPEFWVKTLGHLRGLRRLELDDGCMPDLVPILTRTSDEPTSTPGGTSGHDPIPGPMFVPALEELELRYIRFASKDELPGHGSISRKSLLDALATRKALRPRLKMINCSVEDDESSVEDDDDIVIIHSDDM